VKVYREVLKEKKIKKQNFPFWETIIFKKEQFPKKIWVHSRLLYEPISINLMDLFLSMGVPAFNMSDYLGVGIEFKTNKIAKITCSDKSQPLYEPLDFLMEVYLWFPNKEKPQLAMIDKIIFKFPEV